MKIKALTLVILTGLIIACIGCSNGGNRQNEESSASVAESSVSSAEESITEKFSVIPSSCTIKVGERRTLNLQSSSGREIAAEYIWVSDNNNIVTVDSNGNITGVAEGNASITISKNGISETAYITVEKKEESSVTQSSAESSVQPSVELSVEPPVESQTEISSHQKNLYSYADTNDAYIAYSIVSNYLNESDVASMTSDDAQLLINTIYAKNGYIFTTGHIQTFFESQHWYNHLSNKTKSKDTVASRFSSMDKANIELLAKI